MAVIGRFREEREGKLMKKRNVTSTTVLAAAVTALVGASAGIANATEPCGDFGECKVLVEINSTDGDVGFHFLMDGSDLRYGALFNPKKRKIYSYGARRELARQFVTETFNESAEPLCWYPEEGDDEYGEDVVTLRQFLRRWHEGTYYFFGIGDDWELSFGESELSFELPAAPTNLMYVTEEEIDDDGEIDVEGEISWDEGDDLGECEIGLSDLETPPEEVPVLAWEVVLEPDVDDGDPLGSMKYVVRIPYADEDGEETEREVEVPDDYLETLPDDTPAKVEIGAIGYDDNATFTEIGDICLNEVDGCEDEEEE